MRPGSSASQSREIAARQGIRGPYLDQILASLKREGIVRSIRGAGGGYALARQPNQIRVLDVVEAVGGDGLIVGSAAPAPSPASAGAAYTVRQFALEVEEKLATELRRETIAGLVARQHQLNETHSFMPAI
jgi:Rrf2 family protein